jgi:hypothetical protein
MKKKTAHLCFCTVYCVLGLVGLMLDFKLLSGSPTARPFVFYTSWSNMLCSGFMLASLLQNIRQKDASQGFAPVCKFLFTVMILLTAVVHNFLLEYLSSVLSYFLDVKNCLHHLILPVLFFLDWLFFYPKGTLKLWQPVLSPVIPLAYVCYILARAAFVRQLGITVNVLYPYFFLNVEKTGWQGFGLWMGILFVMLLALGYGIYGIDRMLQRKQGVSAAV